MSLNHPSALLRPIADCFDRSDFQAAAGLLEKLLESGPRELAGHFYFLLAQCYAHLGDVPRSVKASEAERSLGQSEREPELSIAPFANDEELLLWSRLPGSFNRHVLTV